MAKRTLIADHTIGIQAPGGTPGAVLYVPPGGAFECEPAEADRLIARGAAHETAHAAPLGLPPSPAEAAAPAEAEAEPSRSGRRGRKSDA